MASIRLKHHRSHSASSSSPIPRRSPGESWRVATKRAHPQPFGPASPDLSSPQKWDVDVWRRGKRRRKNFSNDSDEMEVDFGRPAFHSSPIPAPAPTPAFAATSADFHLFPEKSNNRVVDRKRRATAESEPDLNFTVARTADLTRLRTDAFWQLQRSVEENGEGFVQSMRVYETRRSRSSVIALKAKEAQRRGRRRSPVHTAPAPARVGSDDEDDVQIFAGEPAFSRAKPRAFSAGVVEEVPHPTGFTRSERCSSPGATCDSRSSIYLSDDDFRVPTPKSPSLSHTLSHSANSSVVSLNLPPPFAPQAVLASSRSEKAIAALSLAMANGAGLDDYEALRSLHTFSPDNCQVGEMWH
ncbi:hypothetical protein B0H16DRAFT_1489139 [Mycena metata]|uniref:Uncharacterized protein n=1 Tax=Mycena metata TaxID=1033252 RepID=A0AAD7KJ77_9AGAR|nr:hypothetical protein B0H16DRAFT_1489139 [Mycena metata]